MRTQKSGPQAPPPYTTSQPQQTQGSASAPQEQTPLLSNSSRIQQEYTYTYTYLSPSNPSQNTPTNEQPPPPYQQVLHHPLFRTSIPVNNRSHSQANKICRLLLLSLLFLAISATLYNSYLLFLHFHPPGINLPLPPKDTAPLRIAVIGAGPAGVGAAVRLSELFSVVGRDAKRDRERQVEIVVFEANDRVGGRMGLGLEGELKIWEGLGVEIGVEDVASAELFADSEGVVRKRAEGLGISFTDKSNEKRESVENVGFLKAEGGFDNYLPRPTSLMPWTQWASLFVRYGSSFVAARNLPTGTMRRFNEMIKMTNNQVFQSMDEWLQTANLKGAVEMSARERMRINGVGEGYRDEIIEAQVRRQLGQSTEELSDLALSLALAREDLPSSRTTSGIKLEDVLAQLLASSGAQLRLGTKLTGLQQETHALKKEPVWKLTFNNALFETEEFDKVILTIPWGKTEESYYRPIITTLIISTTALNLSYLDISSSPTIPSQILPTNPQNIHEITHVRDTFGPELNPSNPNKPTTQALLKLYRVLSDIPLTKEELDGIWKGGVVGFKVVENRFAYPLLFPREGMGRFEVGSGSGCWSTVGGERVGSSVDLSWAIGENVAGMVGRGVEV